MDHFYGLSLHVSVYHRMNTDRGKADFGVASRTDKDAVIFRKRHQILLLNKDDDSSRVADLGHVLVLLYVYN